MAYDTTYSPTTELDAVNMLLFVISESPVNTLDQDTTVAAGTALRLLREESRALQSKGWSFNRDENVALTPNASDNTISFAANTLAVKFKGDDTYGTLAYRSGKVYDRSTQSFVFVSTRAVYADIVLLLGFEDLPESARRYIAVRAARRYQDARLGDGELHQFEREDEERAAADFLADESDAQSYNVVKDSPSVRAVTIRRMARY